MDKKNMNEETTQETGAMNDDMKKAYEQLMRRRRYGAEYMRKFRAERRDEYNAQRRKHYANKKAKEKQQLLEKNKFDK